jgi:hypothetical protein
MPITETQIKSQLPGDAQKSTGNTKEIAGVIDEGLYTEHDMLANQARLMARARGGMAYEDGADFSPQFLKRVRQHNLPKEYVYRHLSEDTLNSLMQGTQQRDQQYVGSNSDWTGYYLEPLAKFVVPFDTPVRNMLPRISSVGTDIINWRAITDVFGGSGPSVGAFILQQQGTVNKANYTWANFSNLLRMLAWSDVVTFESELYGRMFEPDVRAKVAAKLAPSLMLGQEEWYINAGKNLWSPPPPNSPSTSTTGGTVLAGQYWILVTAVNAQGETLAYSYSPYTQAVPAAITVTTTGTTSTITFAIMRVPNAVSYNVYVGSGGSQPANSAMWRQSAATQFGSASALNDPGTGPGQGYFYVTMTAPPVTSGTAYSTVVTAGNTAVAFVSTNPPVGQALTFDGIQALAYVNAGIPNTIGVGGESPYVRQVASPTGALAKSDIDGFLEALYLNARANPECLLVSVKDHKAISNIVAQASAFRINVQNTPAGMSDFVGGGRATKWVNQTTGRVMDIIMVPYLMQGTIIALSLTLPFQVAEIDKPPLRVEVNRDMWAVEYPPDQSHQTQWMYGAYTNETVVNQYLGGTGILSGIVTS